MKNSSLVYVCPEDISWVQDSHQIVIFSEGMSKSFFIRGIEATIWNWLVTGYGFETVANFLSISMDSSQQHAGKFLSDILVRWSSEGILQKVES